MSCHYSGKSSLQPCVYEREVGIFSVENFLWLVFQYIYCAACGHCMRAIVQLCVCSKECVFVCDRHRNVPFLFFFLMPLGCHPYIPPPPPHPTTPLLSLVVSFTFPFRPSLILHFLLLQYHVLNICQPSSPYLSRLIYPVPAYWL